MSVSEKSHPASGGAVSSLTLSPGDGRRALVSTRGGTVYAQWHSAPSPKWTYLWLKQRQADPPTPTQHLAFSPDGLTLLACHASASASANAPLTVWNAQSGKIISNLNGGPPVPSQPAASPTAAAAAATTAATASLPAAPASTGAAAVSSSTMGAAAAADGHIRGGQVFAAWLLDSDSVVSVGWGLEDQTVRLGRGVTRATSASTASATAAAKSLCLGRLNTPYTYFVPREFIDAASGGGGGGGGRGADSSSSSPSSPYYPRALALSPNAKILAVGVGLTLFLFSLVTTRCTQYCTLWDLCSVAEYRRDQQIGMATATTAAAAAATATARERTVEGVQQSTHLGATSTQGRARCSLLRTWSTRTAPPRPSCLAWTRRCWPGSRPSCSFWR